MHRESPVRRPGRWCQPIRRKEGRYSMPSEQRVVIGGVFPVVIPESYNQKLWIHDLTKGATYPPS